MAGALHGLARMTEPTAQASMTPLIDRDQP